MILELSYFPRLLQAAKEMLFENASNELLTFSPMKIERITLEKFDSHQHTEIEQPRSLVKTTCRYIKKKKKGKKETKRRNRRQQSITITKHLLKQHQAR